MHNTPSDNEQLWLIYEAIGEHCMHPSAGSPGWIDCALCELIDLLVTVDEQTRRDFANQLRNSVAQDEGWTP
jgi:hypothetical protein